MSCARAPTKIVSYKIKSAITPRPATRQKFLRAGTSVSMPMKKASAKQNAAVKIEGQISFSAKAILWSTPTTNLGVSHSAQLMRNILSTPTARIKNGSTSAEIIVSF